MPEILTESFCERCGTKYTLGAAEEPRKPAGIKKARLLARGFKNFVMSDDAFEDALAAAELDEDRERAAEQLEAFHQVFNFCMECRQYTCTQCWNPSEGRCLTCAPLPFGIEKDPLFRLGDLAPGASAVRPAPAEGAHPTVVDASAWPTADLARTAGGRPTPPADLQPLGLPDWLAQPAAQLDAPASGNGELVGTEQVPRLMPGEPAAPEQIPAGPEQIAAAQAIASAETPTEAPAAPAPSAAAPAAPPPIAASAAAPSVAQPPAVPPVPRDIAALPEAPLSADLVAQEPESEEQSAAHLALEELASDVAANAPIPEIAPPPAWAREGAAAQQGQPAADVAPVAPAAPEQPAVPGDAFEVKPSAGELAPADDAAGTKGRKRTARGPRQHSGPLPGMSWQAWRATVAKREAGEVEEPLQTASEEPSLALHQGMILEPIVPDAAAEEWQREPIAPRPIAPEASAAAPVTSEQGAPAGPGALTGPAESQPDETMPASRILERLRGAFGRPHAAPQPQGAQPVDEPTPASQLPDAVGFPEPEPLGQAAFAAQQQPIGAPQDAFSAAPALDAEPAAAAAEPPAHTGAQPGWPPVEAQAEPQAEAWTPSLEDVPLELPQAATPQPGERRPEPAPAWQVAPEAPQAPAQQPAWPATPQEPAWPARPQEPAWPTRPQEPAWPTAPAQQPAAAEPPAWPPAQQPAPTQAPPPAQEPAWPAPAREPAWPPAPKQEPTWPAAPEQPAWPAAPEQPAWPPRAPVYQPPAAPAPSWPPQPAPTPSQPATPPAFIARQASAPPSWPPAAQPAQPSASSVWEESSRGVISRPGSGVQACVSCGLALSASARFCRRCGTRQG